MILDQLIKAGDELQRCAENYYTGMKFLPSGYDVAHAQRQSFDKLTRSRKLLERLCRQVLENRSRDESPRILFYILDKDYPTFVQQWTDWKSELVMEFGNRDFHCERKGIDPQQAFTSVTDQPAYGEMLVTLQDLAMVLLDTDDQDLIKSEAKRWQSGRNPRKQGLGERDGKVGKSNGYIIDRLVNHFAGKKEFFPGEAVRIKAKLWEIASARAVKTAEPESSESLACSSGS